MADDVSSHELRPASRLHNCQSNFEPFPRSSERAAALERSVALLNSWYLHVIYTFSYLLTKISPPTLESVYTLTGRP